jgi:hypothetical protein
MQITSEPDSAFYRQRGWIGIGGDVMKGKYTCTASTTYTEDSKYIFERNFLEALRKKRIWS